MTTHTHPASGMHARFGSWASAAVLGAVLLATWWHAESSAAATAILPDATTAAACGALRDVHVVPDEHVEARGWLGLTPAAVVGSGEAVRFLACELRLTHAEGGDTLVRGLVPVLAGSSDAALDTEVTLHDFAEPSGAPLWFAVRVAPADGLRWRDVGSLDQVAVTVVPRAPGAR